MVGSPEKEIRSSGGDVGGGEMADLTLERAADGSEHYEILDEARNVVGHIMLSDAAPPEMPWIWSVASGHHTGRKSTHGYEADPGGGHGGFRKGLASGMTELSLRKSGRRLEDHYDVIADGVVVGRIMMLTPLGRATVGVDRWI